MGYAHIKERRLKHAVTVSKLGVLGDYVPFNFCNRSVMLFVLFKGHDDYSGGQEPILHLVSSVNSILVTGQAWLWTDLHADLKYARQFDTLDGLSTEVDWNSMSLKYWNKPPETKEKRQAEFLVHNRCPWTAIERVVVKNQAMADRVQSIIQVSMHQPQVEVRSDWYY